MIISIKRGKKERKKFWPLNPTGIKISNLYSGNVIVFIISYYEPNYFIEKFLRKIPWESGF